MALTDVFVAVDVGTQWCLGIVGMHHRHVVEAQHSIDFRHGVLESGGGRHVVSGRQAMAGVDAETDLEIRDLSRELADDSQLLEAAS